MSSVVQNATARNLETEANRKHGFTRLLTATEVAEILRLPKTTVYEHARTKLLPSVRIGRSVRFKPDAIRDFIEGGGEALEGGWRNNPEAA